MIEHSLAATLENGCGCPAPRTRASAAARLALRRARIRLTPLGRSVFRLPASLRTRFLLFAVLMVALVVVQGVVGWSVAERSQTMSVTADQGVSASMGDLDLLRTIKNMQVNALVMQNLVATASADDPASIRLDMKKVAKDYATAHAELTRLTTERHMTTLGGINDVGARIDVAKTSFAGLYAVALEAVDAAVKTGKVPAAMTLQVSARVDGLFEHLDRMAEGVDLLAGRDKKDLAETLRGNTAVVKTFQWTMLAAGAIGLLACALVTAFVLRGILGPLSSVAAATQNLAQGRIHDTIPEFIATEIAAITRALAVFRANLLETERLKAAHEASAQQAEEEKRRLMNHMADSLEASIQGVVLEVTDAAGRLRMTATSFSQAAEDATSQAHTVAGASEVAATNVSTVAAATEQLSYSIQEISQQVGSAADFANDAVAQAHQTTDVVTSLSEAVERIGAVVDIIAAIAQRTRMLALNATIEATRAGIYGMGFAVVADEVKGLSAQTAAATAEITAQIRSVQGATREAVTAIATIGSTISRISDISNAITVAVEQQQLATREISRSVQQAAHGTIEVSSNIVGVTRTAQEVGLGAADLMDSSAGLSHQSEALRAAVDTFLMGIRNDGQPLRWGDNWLTGHPAIDAEHQTLVQCINDLNQALNEGNAREILAQILSRLVDYTQRHFANEEAIWTAASVPGLESHLNAHRHLLAKVGEFHAEFAAGRADVSLELMGFLREWLIDHIFKTDKADARTLIQLAA